MTQTGQTEVNQLLQLADVDLDVPAMLTFLPVLCAALREYCAALLNLVQTDESIGIQARSRFGTGSLKLPGSGGATIKSSYSHLVYSLELALQEAASNIVRHGYGGDDPTQRVRLRLYVKIAPITGYTQRRALIVELYDFGQTFDPTHTAPELPDPTELSESGYGLYLIHKLTDQLSYFEQDGQNCLQMLKFI